MSDTAKFKVGEEVCYVFGPGDISTVRYTITDVSLVQSAEGSVTPVYKIKSELGSRSQVWYPESRLTTPLPRRFRVFREVEAASGTAALAAAGVLGTTPMFSVEEIQPSR